MDFATVLYDTASGRERWITRYSGPGDGWDVPAAVAYSPDGTRLYVTGGSRGDGSKQDFATVAYDAATGAEIWTARYDGSVHEGDAPVALVVSPDGRAVFVSGQSIRGFGSSGRSLQIFVTVAYDAVTGQPRWVRSLDPSGSVNYLWASTITLDGGTLFVTGWGRGKGVGEAAEAAAYDAATGQVKWVMRPRGVAAFYAVTASPDGETLFVSGQAHHGDEGFSVAALSVADGSELWRTTTQTPAKYAVSWALTLGPDGRSLYATGTGDWQRGPCGYPADYTTVAYDAATGHELWRARYNGPGKGDEWAQAVATSPDGSRVYVTGSSAGFGGAYACAQGTPHTGLDFATVAYDASAGTRIWVRRYDTPGKAGRDSAHALVIDGLGNIFVSGEGNFDFLTLRYEP